MSLKRHYPDPYIAREGHPYIVFLLLAILGASILGFWGLSVLLWIALILVMQFFRDPARNLPDADSRQVLCPADGRVVAIEEGLDPYRKSPALKISIFMNVFNVHVNRLPLSGKIEKVEYFPGSFVNASLDKASEENERNALWLETPAGEKVTVVQIAGLVARRILCYAEAGDTGARGERYGFIRFGSRVDLYLPEDTRPAVALGNKVKGMTSILATLPPLPKSPDKRAS